MNFIVVSSVSDATGNDTPGGIIPDPVGAGGYGAAMNPSVRHPSVGIHRLAVRSPPLFSSSRHSLLTGCFRFESTYTINDDGTADVSILTVIDTEQLEELGGLLGQDTSELMGLGGEDLLSTLSEGDDPCSDVIGSLTGYDVRTRGDQRRVRGRREVHGLGRADRRADDLGAGLLDQTSNRTRRGRGSPPRSRASTN